MSQTHDTDAQNQTRWLMRRFVQKWQQAQLCENSVRVRVCVWSERRKYYGLRCTGCDMAAVIRLELVMRSVLQWVMSLCCAGTWQVTCLPAVLRRPSIRLHPVPVVFFRPSVRLSVCLSVCLSILERCLIRRNGPWVPYSNSRCSFVFKFPSNLRIKFLLSPIKLLYIKRQSLNANFMRKDTHRCSDGECMWP